jgi:hypothetical protein
VIVVTAACFGLIPALLFGPAANAQGLDGASVADAESQTLVVATGAPLSVLRDGYAANAPTEASIAAISSTNADWVKLVLTDGGWPVTDSSVTALLQWMDSENDPHDWWLRNNPLNNGYGSGGGSGFGSYDDLVEAAHYAAENLSTNSVYTNIIAALSSSASVDTIVSAIQNSPWASSHYGYGSLWHAVDVPIVAAPGDAW